MPPDSSTWQQLPVPSCGKLTAPLSPGASAWGWGASAQLVPMELLGSRVCRACHHSVQQRISCCGGSRSSSGLTAC